jgi:hypothetical protein
VMLQVWSAPKTIITTSFSKLEGPSATC